MLLEHINDRKLLEECEKKGIKRINAAYRWLRRNPTKSLDDYITYCKSRPNKVNYKYCKDNDLSYNTVRQWVARAEGRTAEGFVNRPPFLTQLCKDYDINYKAAEKWLWNHKKAEFNDYVNYLNKKATKPPGKIVYQHKTSAYMREHPNATLKEYYDYLKNH